MRFTFLALYVWIFNALFLLVQSYIFSNIRPQASMNTFIASLSFVHAMSKISTTGLAFSAFN